MLYVIASLIERDGSKWLTRGYKILDSNSGKFRLLSEETIAKERLCIMNAEFKSGIFCGTQGDLNRYTKLNVLDGSIVGFTKMVILGLDTEGFYLTVVCPDKDSDLIVKCSKNKLKSYIRSCLEVDNMPIANGKVLNNENKMNIYFRPIKGKFEIIKECPKYLEKKFDFENKNGNHTNRWLVRVLRKEERQGKDFSLAYREEPMVAFFDLEQDKDSFPIGQYVGSYYLSTLLQGESGLDLIGYVDKWKLNKGCMDEVRNWLCSLNLCSVDKLKIM